MSYNPKAMGPPKSPPQTTHTGPTTLSAKTQYLVLYNLLSLVLWLSIILRVAITFALTPAASGTSRPFLAAAYITSFDTVRWTQSLAVLEVLHAVIGIVRTSPFTTGMQVASRLLLVWGVLQPFGRGLLVEGSGTLLQKSQNLGLGGVPGIEKAIGGLAFLGAKAGSAVGALGGASELNEVQRNQAAYVGMLIAWSVTECVRYSYFIYYAGSEAGKAPAWLTWLR